MNIQDLVFPIYGARVRGVEALLAVVERRGEEATLAAAADDLTEAAERVEGMQAGWAYSRFGELLGMVAGLHRWRDAIRGAEQEAERHVRAVRLRADEFKDEHKADPRASGLVTVASSIVAVKEPSEIPQIASALLKVALPIPLELRDFRVGQGAARRSSGPEPRPLVAVVAFTLNGQPLADPQTAAPNLLHDLEIQVELSQWPKEARRLVLDPISVEPPDVYTIPRYEFSPPNGPGPHRLVGRSRMQLRSAQAISARPLEFQYRAFFEPQPDVRLEVTGHRLLRLQSYDPALTPVTGYGYVDAALLAIRNAVRLHAGIPDVEILDFLQVLRVLGRTAGEALQDAIFPGQWSEADFQGEIRARLRADPAIGAELTEHASASGGISDLGYHRIPIELKSEPEHTLSPDDAVNRFGGQTAQYTVANDRRLGILCVLDCAPKQHPPGPVENDIVLRPVTGFQIAGTPVLLGIVIVRGNLARPSDWSRGRGKGRSPNIGQ